MQKSTKQSTWKRNSAEVAEVRQELGSGLLKETRPWEPRLKSSSPFSPRAFFLLFCAWLRALHRHRPACHKPEGIFEHDFPFHPVFCCIIDFLGGPASPQQPGPPLPGQFRPNREKYVGIVLDLGQTPHSCHKRRRKVILAALFFCHIRRRSTCSTEKART